MSAVALSNPFRTSIGQKFIVAITGIFLITFLIVHVAGNLLLFVGAEEFNAYAHFMATNPIIRTMEVVLFAGFIGHIVTALAVTFKSRKARKVSYKKTDYSKSANWYSRYMAVSGSLLLLFLIVHLIDFWVGERFMTMDEELYTRVERELSELSHLIIYVVGIVVLMLHLLHGFYSAFQTIGININTKLGRIINGIGVVFAVVISALFASMPIYFFILGQS